MASEGVEEAVKLFEHPDFEQAIIRAAAHFRTRGLREAIIEKDYYVTEALRIIEAVAGANVIFKGGTSLSKGWNLIQRFSEDIDIFLDPTGFDPPLGKKVIDRELKKLRQSIEKHPALKFVDKESQTIGGFGRNDRFEYVQRFAGAGEIRNRVFVEAGTASGKEPTERVRLQSYVGQFLQETVAPLGHQLFEELIGLLFGVLAFRRGTFDELVLPAFAALAELHDPPTIVFAEERFARHRKTLQLDHTR
jgi:hypothetical protein